MTVLAAAPAANDVVTGVLGFLVVAAIGVALFFLLRSMNKHLRRVMPPEPKWRGNAPGPAGGSRSEHQPVGEQDRPGPG